MLCVVHCVVVWWCQQEDDVIGTLASNEKIASMKPLGDRVLIKVGERGRAKQGGKDGRQNVCLR